MSEKPDYLPPAVRSQLDLARSVVEQLDDGGRLVLAAWLEAMIQIRNSPVSDIRKAKLALRATFGSKATWPILKALALALGETVKSATSSWAGRVGLVSVGGLVIFGSQAAGIAAFGSAIAVPLWIVIGGGYAFAEALQRMLLAVSNTSDKNSSN